MSTPSLADNRQVVNPAAAAGPCTNVAAETFGPVTVTLYEKWHGLGWIVTARNGHELERHEYNYAPAALARYATMRRKYRAEWEDAQMNTMLGLYGECSCTGANRDGCPMCRATAARLYGCEVAS